MSDRTWILHRDPSNPYGGTFTLGDRSVPLPDDAVISLTLGTQFTVWRTLVNSIVSKFVQRQLVKTPHLLYSELVGDLKQGYGLTMSVWSGQAREMARFRDSGAHKFAMKFFSWVFYSGTAQSYFLTFPANGRIPTADEAIALVQAHGRHFDGGKLVRKATRFNWGQAVG